MCLFSVSFNRLSKYSLFSFIISLCIFPIVLLFYISFGINISLHQLEALNKIKNPIVYRIVSFFITQSKRQSWELFRLLTMLTPMEFDTKKKRHRILKSIQENIETLKHYGITATEEKKGKFKTYILSYKKPKDLNVELGKHINNSSNG